MRGEVWPDRPVLPPCPVIGLGPQDALGAEFVDAIIEAPAALEVVLAQIEANPLAASVVVQLLRILPELDLAAGLVAESLAYATLQGSAEHKRWLAATGARGDPAEAGFVQVERIADVLDVTLDRPLSDNAIDRPMRDGLYEAFQLAAVDRSIERVVLRAKGKAFSLGADLDEFGTTSDPATAHAIRSATLPAHMAMHIADRLEVRVQGACAGSGLELAAFASRIVAGPKAWFQLPELSMGILPGAGGCVSLTRRIGRQRAALLILSGKRVSARTALEWGLVDDLVDDPA
ncbi:MAG: enoyl-CoA hydratase/isomerase family protein [Novosphingobium sp.]|nr:enoyl-CoA hydratase/isomerase family protein [Novosphingobium sp.]